MSDLLVGESYLKLEKQILERYGKKRGRAMIEDARQRVEYEIGDRACGRIEYTRMYEKALQNKL